MKHSFVFVLLWSLATISLAGTAESQAAKLVRTAVTELVEMTAEKTANEGAEEGIERVGARISKTAIAELVERTGKEGGDLAIERLLATARQHGTDVLFAVRNLDELPGVSVYDVANWVDEVPMAAPRLAAGVTGRQLAEHASTYGSKVLSADVLHPGVGGRFIAKLGGHGDDLVQVLPTQEVIRIVRYTGDDLASSPAVGQLTQIMGAQPEQFTGWLRRFAQDNPGKLLLTAATASIVIARPEILLGDGEIVFDADGNPQYVETQRGMLAVGQNLGQSTLTALKSPITLLLMVITIGMGVWITIRLLPSAFIACQRMRRLSTKGDGASSQGPSV